jgi:hypothetical protein
MTNGNTYITWKYAVGALCGIVLGAASLTAWVKADVDTKVSRVEYQSMQDDIRIIKKCLIERKCGD